MRYHRRQVLSAEHVHFCPQNLTLGGNAPEMLKVLVRLLFDFPQTVILSTVGEQTYHETCCFQLCRPWYFGTKQEHFSDQKRAVCFGIVFHWLQKLWTAMLYRDFNLMISLCKVRSFKMSMLSNFIHQFLHVGSGYPSKNVHFLIFSVHCIRCTSFFDDSPPTSLQLDHSRAVVLNLFSTTPPLTNCLCFKPPVFK